MKSSLFDVIRDAVSELIIRKHLLLLRPEEISEKIDEVDLEISDEMKMLLKNQDSVLNDEAYINSNHAGLQPAVQSLSRAIVVVTGNSIVNGQKMVELFDKTVLILSIYYQYNAVLYDSEMYAFLRLVLEKKIFLI